MSGVDIEVVVIGAGVIGLAVARALATAGRETVVLEAEAGIGREISSRSSEVIHAGLYYPTGSLKARLCLEGKAALYAFCATHMVPHERSGKIVVATEDGQQARLAALYERATANGVDDLRWLSRADLAAMEPELRASSAFLSPSTGIVDSHALMLALQGELEAHGGNVALSAPVVAARVHPSGIALETGGKSPTTLVARHVVLAAGLASSEVARLFVGLAPASIPTTRFAKGNYFALDARAPFTRLIYPLPEPGGIGVHLTFDLAGRARFGPDVEWLDTPTSQDIDFTVDPARATRFEEAVRRWWPQLPRGALTPDYAGVRPKLARPGEPDADFRILTAEDHGMRGLVALYGIESPGLTASIALAAHIAARL